MPRGNVRVGITADSSGVAREVKTAERHLDRFGKAGTKSMKTLGGAAGILDSRLGKLAKAASLVGAGYLAIAEGKDAINVTTDLAKATIGLHKNLGLSVKSASEWASVAKVRGIEMKQLNQGFGTFAKNADKATQGTDAQVKAFKRLGIAQGEIKKVGFNKLLGEAADGLKNMEPGVKKTSTAMQLFGRGWQTIVPVLRDGSKAMNEQLALAEKYGATFSGGTVKSTKDLIQAQREAKFATLGLQVAFGTQLAPALTKGINAASHFVAEIRSGTGAGGKFADKAKEIADRLKPGVTLLIGAAKWAKKFGDEHPGIAKVAVQVAAVGAAFKLFKIGTAVKAVKNFTEAAIATPGQVKGALSGVKRIFTSVFTSAGTAGGTTGAEAVGTAIAKKNRFFSSIGTKSGKLIGKGLVIGIVAGLVAFGPDIRDEVQKQIDKAIPDGINLGPIHIPTPRFLGGLGNDRLTAPGNRAGGIIGGAKAVPGMLSPGEVGVEPDGRAWRVPGPRVAADTVPMMLRPGTAILTGSGQRMVAAGASVGQAVARQAPHFREGGVARMNEYKRLLVMANRQVGLPQPSIGAGLIDVESGWNPNAVSPKGAFGLTQFMPGTASGYGVKRGSSHSAVASQILGMAKYLKALGYGSSIRTALAKYNGGPGNPQYGYAADVLAAARKYPPGSFKGVAGGGGVPGFSYHRATPAPISHPLLGNMLAPLTDDALMGGIQAGQEGIGRRGLLTDVLEGILPQSGDRATYQQVSRSGLAGSRGSAGGGFHPGGGWGGTKNLVMGAIRGLGDHRTFKRNQVVNGNTNSDHLTSIKNAFAADLSPGSDSIFSTIAHRLHIAARKGSWNIFPNKPLGGYRSQLLWHAPDGSHYDHVHLGIRKMRRGGIVGYGPGGVVHEDDWNWNPRTMGNRAFNPYRMLRRLGRDGIGTEGADILTRQFSRVLPGAGMTQLVKSQRLIRRLIRRMARHGFTGPERIRSRRLQGALSLVQDEMGRPIGRALGASDRAQTQIGRDEANLPNQLTLLGIDPDSSQGLAAQRDLAGRSLGTLGTRRAALTKALKRAKRTHNKAAIRTVRGELNEVDDQVLGLQASIVQLNKTMEQAKLDALTEALQEQNRLREEATAVEKQKVQLAQTQGPQLQLALAGLSNGWIGGNAGLGRSFPSYAGLGGLART